MKPQAKNLRSATFAPDDLKSFVTLTLSPVDKSVQLTKAQPLRERYQRAVKSNLLFVSEQIFYRVLRDRREK
jgi:hypothetical protein